MHAFPWTVILAAIIVAAFLFMAGTLAVMLWRGRKK
jgi:hypothetical protein